MKHDKYSKKITIALRKLFMTEGGIKYRGKENAISSYFIVNYVLNEINVKPKDEIYHLFWRERIMQTLWNLINPKTKYNIFGLTHVLGLHDGKEVAYFFYPNNEKEVIESKNTLLSKSIKYEKSAEIKSISNMKFINQIGYDGDKLE